MSLTRVHETMTKGFGDGSGGDDLGAVTNTFTSDGEQTVFELSRDPVSEDNTQVYFSGVYQNKGNYTIVGRDITFSTAPPEGEVVEIMIIYSMVVSSEDEFVKKSGDTMTGDLTIDGNLLVGHTIAFSPIENGGSGVTATVDGQLFAGHAGPPLYVNREDSDGDIAVFRKDGSEVGSIGSSNGDLTVGTGDVGIKFNDEYNTLMPFNVTTNSEADDVFDLGAVGNRFKDLYLSGGVYLGGTELDNKLDDYEEGTWVPNYSSDGTAPSITYSSERSASYTKIGNTVFFNGSLRTSTVSGGSGNVLVTGLPFATASATTPNSTKRPISVHISYQSGFGDLHPTGGYQSNSASNFYLVSSPPNVGVSNITVADMGAGVNGNFIMFSGQYITD